MDWPRLLAYITGRVDQELLLRNEYLAAENRILKAQIKGRLLHSEEEKTTLAEITRRLGRKALEEVACTAQPDTILGWYRKLIANKFDGSRFRQSVGRPRVDQAIENLIVRIARENSTWGYDRIVGALANLGRTVSDQTVGNILQRHGIAPAPRPLKLPRLGATNSPRKGSAATSILLSRTAPSARPITSSTTTVSATTRGKLIGSCFLRRWGQERTGEQCGVENDWAYIAYIKDAGNLSCQKTSRP